VLEIQLQNSSEAEEYLRDNKSKFFILLVDAVEDSYDYDLESLLVARIELVEESINMDITVDKENWGVTLDLAIEHYTETEEFEQCIRINEVRDKVGL